MSIWLPRCCWTAFDNDCDEVVVIFNDSDLIAPVTAIRQRFGKRVGIISSQRAQRRSSALAQAGVVVIWHHQPAAFCQQPTAAAANRRQRDFYQTGNVVRNPAGSDYADANAVDPVPPVAFSGYGCAPASSGSRPPGWSKTGG